MADRVRSLQFRQSSLHSESRICPDGLDAHDTDHKKLTFAGPLRVAKIGCRGLLVQSHIPGCKRRSRRLGPHRGDRIATEGDAD